MAENLVNSIYPVDYFDLKGVDVKTADNQGAWWSSKSRGSGESDYLELDLGRTRAVNFIAFDILKTPVDIDICFDPVSLEDGSRTWETLSFIDSVHAPTTIRFKAHAGAWQHVQYQFDTINTRYIRIGFARRDDVWPSDKKPITAWTVDVANLRTGRLAQTVGDTRGLILDGGDPTTVVAGVNPSRILQQFMLPDGYQRGSVYPDIVGAGVLVTLSPTASELDAALSTFTVTVLENVNSGTVTVSRQTVSSSASGYAWLDIYFGRYPTVTAATTTLTTPTTLPAGTIPVKSTGGLPASGTVVIGNQSVQYTSIDATHLYGCSGGTGFFQTGTAATIYIPKRFSIQIDSVNNPLATDLVLHAPAFASTNRPPNTLTVTSATAVNTASATVPFRVWGTVGEEGTDVLGNKYREAVLIDKAQNAVDDNGMTMWMSEPKPSPRAVESLYLDVRHTMASGAIHPSVICGVDISTVTPGVFMHVYYTCESNNHRPGTIEDWEMLLWNPVPQTYLLAKSDTFEFPWPIRASYVQLEFSRLQPTPTTIPSYPAPPPVTYKEYPTEVASIFDPKSGKVGLQRDFSSIDPSDSTIVKYTPYSVFENVQEYKVKPRLIPEPPTSEASTTADVSTDSASRVIMPTGNKFASDLLGDPGRTVLSQIVQLWSADPETPSPPVESPADPALPRRIPLVSNLNDRAAEAYHDQAVVPVYWPYPARKSYKQAEANFSGTTAYYVAISDVSLFRIDYTVMRNYAIIADDLMSATSPTDSFASPLVGTNTFVPDYPSRIVADGATPLYVTYEVGGVQYTDTITLTGYSPASLSASGRAYNITVTSGPNGTGLFYNQTLDYDVSYLSSAQRNSIMKTQLHYRLLTEPSASATSYVDVDTAISRALIQ